MNCPRCRESISPDDFYCSSCGKLLKIECPRCGTINKGSTCSKCHLKLLIKCKVCNETNHVISIRCRKCRAKIAGKPEIQNVKIHKFAIVCVELENLDATKTIHGIDFEDFKKVIHKLIHYEAAKFDGDFKVIQDGLVSISLGNKDNLEESCTAAIELTLATVKVVHKLNAKLKNLRNTYLKTKIGVSVSTVFDRRSIARTERSISYGEPIEVIVNPTVYKYTSEKYSYEQLVSIFVNQQMRSFYKLDLNQINFADDSQDIFDKDYENIDEEDKSNILNLPKINFLSKRSTRLTSSQSELQKTIEDIFTNHSGNLINVIGSDDAGKLDCLSGAFKGERFKSYKSFRIDCNDSTGLYPFGLIRNIIRTYLELGITIPDSDNNRIKIRQKLSTLLIDRIPEFENLIMLESVPRNNVENTRLQLFSQIKDFFFTIGDLGKLIFIIDDFDKIDRNSLECLKFLIGEKILSKNISFIISTKPDFILTRTISDIDYLNNYYEIVLKPDKKSQILKYFKIKDKNLKSNFQLIKIIESSKGSVLYIKQALHYLIEEDILKYKSGELRLNSDMVVPVPADINNIIQRRVIKLINNPILSDIYLKLILLGPSVETDIIKKLFTRKDIEIYLTQLKEMELIEYSSKHWIYINNYALFKNCVLKLVDKDTLFKTVKQIFTAFDLQETITHPFIFEGLEYTGNTKESLKVLNEFAALCLHLGDIPAYTICVEKYLACLDDALNKKDKDPAALMNLNAIKQETFEQIGELSYDIYPDIAYKFLKKAISSAEKQQNKEKTIRLASFMAQSCSLTGNYEDVISYIGKIVANVPKEVFDIKNNNFAMNYYLLNFIKVQALFNLGKLERCIELSREVIKTFEEFKNRNENPESINAGLVNRSLLDTELFLLKSKILQLNLRFGSALKKASEHHPESQPLFDMLSLANDVLHGTNKTSLDSIDNLLKKGSSDKETKLLGSILAVICKIQFGNWQEVANIAYDVRPVAENLKDYQAMYFLDLVIGMAYKEINNPQKAKQIYEDVLKLGAEKSLLNIMLMSWYLIADLELSNGNLNIAFEIANKANIILERDHHFSKVFSLYFKSILAKILRMKGSLKEALRCAEQSMSIATNQGLHYNQVVCSLELIHIYEELLKTDIQDDLIQEYNENLNILKDNISKINQKLNNSYLSSRTSTVLAKS